MNSIISWVGGKKALRDLIYLRMPKHYDRYIEVFGGGGWVLFGKPPDKCMEVYNDFNSNLANLFYCVKERPMALLRELSFLPLNSRDGKKKIVWRCSNRLTNGTKNCKKSETLEEGALNRAVMEAINRITRGDVDFAEAFRQNVIRVIGSYGGEQEPDEYDEKIKEKEEEMVALIAENARVGSYTDEFDERYRRIAEEINTLKEEQIETRRKKKLADSYEQRLKDMDSFLEKQTCQIPEFDNDLVRRLIASIKVVSAEKLIIQFQSGIVMEQEIRYE